MNTIFNFGDPHKNFKEIAKKLLDEYEEIKIPVTNNIVYKGSNLQIVSACYGHSQTWDTLDRMKEIGLLSKGDSVVFVGSFGSISRKIRLGDLIIPVQVEFYLGKQIFRENWIKPSGNILKKLETVLNNKKIKYAKVEHGCTAAVFEPHVDAKNYKCNLYNANVKTLDLESFPGLIFCKRNNLEGVVLLYCADSPEKKIEKIPKEEFDRMAVEKDFLLNKIAFDVLKNV